MRAVKEEILKESEDVRVIVTVCEGKQGRFEGKDIFERSKIKNRESRIEIRGSKKIKINQI